MVDVVHFFQDLKKWKTRRRSTKSELRTKSQDREHVMDKMINGSVTTIEKNEAKLKYVCATIVFKKNKFLKIFKQCLMYSYLQWHERIFFTLYSFIFGLFVSDHRSDNNNIRQR